MQLRPFSLEDTGETVVADVLAVAGRAGASLQCAPGLVADDASLKTVLKGVKSL